MFVNSQNMLILHINRHDRNKLSYKRYIDHYNKIIYAPYLEEEDPTNLISNISIFGSFDYHHDKKKDPILFKKLELFMRKWFKESLSLLGLSNKKTFNCYDTVSKMYQLLLDENPIIKKEYKVLKESALKDIVINTISNTIIVLKDGIYTQYKNTILDELNKKSNYDFINKHESFDLYFYDNSSEIEESKIAAINSIIFKEDDLKIQELIDSYLKVIKSPIKFFFTMMNNLFHMNISYINSNIYLSIFPTNLYNAIFDAIFSNVKLIHITYRDTPNSKEKRNVYLLVDTGTISVYSSHVSMIVIDETYYPLDINVYITIFNHMIDKILFQQEIDAIKEKIKQKNNEISNEFADKISETKRKYCNVLTDYYAQNNLIHIGNGDMKLNYPTNNASVNEHIKYLFKLALYNKITDDSQNSLFKQIMSAKTYYKQNIDDNSKHMYVKPDISSIKDFISSIEIGSLSNNSKYDADIRPMIGNHKNLFIFMAKCMIPYKLMVKNIDTPFANRDIELEITVYINNEKNLNYCKIEHVNLMMNNWIINHHYNCDIIPNHESLCEFDVWKPEYHWENKSFIRFINKINRKLETFIKEAIISILPHILYTHDITSKAEREQRDIQKLCDEAMDAIKKEDYDIKNTIVPNIYAEDSIEDFFTKISYYYGESRTPIKLISL